jgi:phosphatidylglycerophosphate synthase
VDPIPLTDGERWTRERLEELSEAGFTPFAITSFLAAARGRASDERRARAGLARQARSWSAVGALAWLALAASGRGQFRVRLRSGLASWGATSLMVSWHLGMVETEDGEPRRLGPADACTLLRAWLVPLVAPSPGPAVVALALVSDVLDGLLARATRPTRFGRDLEGVVDSAFAAAALRGFARRCALGRPTVALEAGRLATGTLYAVRRYFLLAEPPDRALARAGRIATPVRGAGMIAAALGRRRAADTLVCVAAAVSAAVAANRHRRDLREACRGRGVVA